MSKFIINLKLYYYLCIPYHKVNPIQNYPKPDEEEQETKKTTSTSALEDNHTVMLL